MLKIKHVQKHIDSNMLNSGIQHVESSKSSIMMMKAVQAKQQVQMRLLRAETSV
jgi:hypothetical protein